MSTAEKVTNIPVKQSKSRRHWLPRRRERTRDVLGEMDRLFNTMMGRTFLGGWPQLHEDWPFGGTLAMDTPQVDLIDRDNEIVLRAEIPGVGKDDLDVSLTDNTVTLRGTAKHEEEKEEDEYYFCETSRGEFARTIPLPVEVDGAKAKANYKDGMLELILPKIPEAKPHKIKVE